MSEVVNIVSPGATQKMCRIDDASASESDSGLGEATFVVTLSEAVDFPVSVNYATANSTAAAGSDYLATSGTLHFAPGEISQQGQVCW